MNYMMKEIVQKDICLGIGLALMSFMFLLSLSFPLPQSC